MKKAAIVLGLAFGVSILFVAAYWLVRRAGQAPEQGHAGHAGHGPPADSGRDGLDGYATVELTAERIQKFGVRTEKATRASLTRTVRTVGIVRTDETRESRVQVKWTGWIEEFYVSYVGQSVRAGDSLFSVYSPDLVTAQEEFLIAAKHARLEANGAAGDLLSAARMKLRLWDVPEETIEQLEKTGRARRAVTIRAPRDGVVMSRMAVPGMFVEPSMELYRIADLSRVWVLADLYEYEMAIVREGQEARFAVLGETGDDLRATVTFIPPTVAAATRTVKVRLELSNPDLRLRPGAYGTVRIEVAGPMAVTVPADAVIDTGTRQLVFVHVGQGRFSPRAVRMGVRTGDRREVREGIAEGEEVVTRAQFMLDSESRLRAASEAGGRAGHGGH